jgi:hypothetical protein
MSYMMQNIAIIVGNGPSRNEIQLDSLVGQGTIFGCNALYRDFDGYDFLVAIDDRMINEIKTTEKKLTGQAIFPPEDERWESSDFSPMRRRSNAGMNAMIEAIKRDHNVLYCLGFDFILSGEGSLGNVYKDSVNYTPDTQPSYDDNYNRIKYLEWFCNQHPDVKFVFVIPDGSNTKSLDADNIIGMHMSTFLEKTK